MKCHFALAEQKVKDAIESLPKKPDPKTVHYELTQDLLHTKVDDYFKCTICTNLVWNAS